MARLRPRGVSLLEVMIAVALVGVLFAGLSQALRTQAQATGRTLNDSNVFVPAATIIARIQDELRSAVKDPSGLTGAYTVTNTSITFRPVLGYITSVDPNYATYASENRISSNSILYASYLVQIIWYPSTDATPSNRNKIFLKRTASPTLPANLPSQEVIGQNVSEFLIFDGERDKASPPNPVGTHEAPSDLTYVLGIRVVVSGKSADPVEKGKTVDSNVAKIPLTVKVLVRPETLVNSKSKPAVGP